MGACNAKTDEDSTEISLDDLPGEAKKVHQQAVQDAALIKSRLPAVPEKASDTEDEFHSCQDGSSKYASESSSVSHSEVSSSDEVPCRTLKDLGGLGQQPPAAVKTLKDLQNTSSSYQDYLARKERKKNKGKSGMGTKDFLSGLNEVDTDIAYRFNFSVLGPLGAQAVERACNSKAARDYDGNQPKPESIDERAELPGDDTEGMQKGKSRGPVAYRCLCPVPFPADPNKRLTLAKLAFDYTQNWKEGSWQKAPVCCSRLEAATSCMVFVLTVNPDLDRGHRSFEDQLQGVTQLMQSLRSRSPPELRPVRAAFLCRCGEETEETSNEEGWKSELADFEEVYGTLMKFGPFSIRDGDALHSTFATIASERILKSQKEGEAGDLEEEEEKLPPMWGEAEAENEDNEDNIDTFDSEASQGRSSRFSNPLRMLGRSGKK